MRVEPSKRVLKRPRRIRMSDHSMKRTYFPGITDIVVVTDPAEIRTISNDSRFDRDFIGRGPVRNVLLLRKILRIFSLNGRLFAIILPRTNPSRAAAQEELRSRLNVKADEVKHGPAELEPLAEWVRGNGTEEKVDLLVQQSIGRLFVETFTATEESLAAAHMVLEAVKLFQCPENAGVAHQRQAGAGQNASCFHGEWRSEWRYRANYSSAAHCRWPA